MFHLDFKSTWAFKQLVRVSACTHTKSYPSLRSRDYSPPGSSVHGISQARKQEWAAISFSRGSSWPRGGTRVSVSSALAGGYSLPLRCLEIPLNDWFLYFLRKYVFIPLFIIPAYLYYQIHAHLRDIFGSFSDHLNKASYTKCSVF